MTTVPALIAAMAQRIATVPGISAVHYPAPTRISRRREVVLYWGSDDDTVIESDPGQRRKWNPAIKAQILTPAEGNTPAEFAEIDSLIHPIVDAFDEQDAPRMLSVLGAKVDRCNVVRVRPTLLIEYAGVPHYGAELFFSVKFHRRVGE